MSYIAQVIKNQVREQIWDVVEESLSLGLDPKDFLIEVRASWWQGRIDQRNRDDKVFEKRIKNLQ